MGRAVVVGGGLAGLAAAAALGSAGHQVDLYEARAFLGGRATSYRLPEFSEPIDNCQHVLLACFVNLLDLYERLGVRDRIRFYREFYFLEPGGRVSTLRDGLWSFLRLGFLGFRDKVAIARALRAMGRERGDLEGITMLDWLRGQRQTPAAIERFWRQVLVSAINEDLDRMAARYGLQVFQLGLLAGGGAHHMGLSAAPLSELYGSAAGLGNVAVHLRAPVERLSVENGRVVGPPAADYYVLAVPFERVGSVVPELALDLSGLAHSPITGIHLWFDRPVMDLPYATLLDRTIQWAFNKGEGRYVQVVVSASRSLVNVPRQDVVALALRELAEFFPRVKEARIEEAHVVKEVRATFSARPGIEAARPASVTQIPNLFLAGDWTRTGWPATMEGAVRSGYLAAEAITGRRFLR
jgi:squalene-associated FAD-dependent desaturase